MAVFRVERNKGYTVMSNHHLRNVELTLKAKGLLSQMLSLPESWDYTFYIVIDYDAPVNEEEEQYQTYFLNMVDEADLLSLMDDAAVEKLTTCVCADKCVVGDINVECPVCKNNMSECSGVVPEPPAEEPDPEPTEPEKPEKKSNVGMILAVIAIVGIGGGAYYYFRFVRGKKQKDDDLDFFDDEGYEEEPYVNEDAEPDIAEDGDAD